MHDRMRATCYLMWYLERVGYLEERIASITNMMLSMSLIYFLLERTLGQARWSIGKIQ